MSVHINDHGSGVSLSSFLSRNATIALVSMLCMLVVGHDLYDTWAGRSREIEDSRRKVSTLALAATQHAEGAFQLADNSLIDLVERVQADGIGPRQIEHLRKLMVSRLVASPGLQGLTVIDEAGDRVIDGQPVTEKINLADRGFFQYHLTHPDRGPYTSIPLLSRTAGIWIVLVSRRVDHADGSFAGVVTATVDVKYFLRFYATLETGHGGSTSLWRDDGILLVRHPSVEAPEGEVLGSSAFRGALVSAPGGGFETASQFDGRTKIVGYRRVPGFPLVVVVALDKDEQLATWQVTAAWQLVSAIVVVVLLGFLVYRLTRQMRSLSRAEHAASVATERATEALARYRLLADNSSDMIVVVDRRFVRRYVSPSCRELLGYEPEELIGKAGDLDLHPEDAERVMADFQLLLADASPGHNRVTYRLRHRDGHWVWIESVRKVIGYSETGEAMEVCSALRDVGVRVAAEIELRDNEERFRALLNSGLTEACYLLDDDGNILTWNSAAERIKGYSAAEIIGQNFAVFFTPEDVAQDAPSRTLAETRAKGSFTAEVWRVRKDGSRFPARVALETIFKADGSVRGFVKVTFDLTNQLIEKEERAIIIEAAPNGMMIVNESGVITLANSQMQRIFGYPDGTLPGQPVETLVPEGFRAQLSAAFASDEGDTELASQRQFTGERYDGTPVIVEIMRNSFKTPKGRIVVASFFDLTERLRLATMQQKTETERLAAAETNDRLDRLSQHLAEARDRAEEANHAKSRFLTGITHELRTPLHGILGCAELLSLEGSLNPTQAEHVATMIASGEHLLGMINAVLDVAQIESGRMELSSVEIALADLAKACFDIVRPTAKAKGLDLVLTAATPGCVFGDVTRLRQVLINLLGNAIKFTPSGKVELRLTRAEAGDWVRLEVIDTGPGVLARHRDKLFQTFERLNADAVAGFEGTGLGLALSAQLVRAMDGRIGYEDNPGGGSVFWVELPASSAEPATPDAGAAPGRAAMPSVRVLVVDDDALNRDIATRFLTLGGNEVVCLDNGPAAVEAAKTEDFDVILMDVRMPGMNGLEATRLIRLLPAPRGMVPIIALTAQAFAEQIEIIRRAGMDAHVSKPFKQAVLLAAVDEVARKRRIDTPEDSATIAGHHATEAKPPLFDRVAFEDTTDSLSPDQVGEYLRTLIARGETLLSELRAPDILARASILAEGAHKLAGGAAMLGFMELADSGRQFENHVDAGGEEAITLADQLAGTIVAAVTAMRREMARTAASAT